RCPFSYSRARAHRSLLSFPTRRSSDLEDDAELHRLGAGVAELTGEQHDRAFVHAVHHRVHVRVRAHGRDLEQDIGAALGARVWRSEEHTSDSSHVKISYAVFCLKKKKQ